MDERLRVPTTVVLLLGLVSLSATAEPVVLREDVVTRFSAADNGATPMWCYGSPIIARHRGEVYVSVIETGKDVPPLCNTRWQLWRRQAIGWKLILTEQDYRQREPCPLVSLPSQGLFLSSNPSLTKPGTRYRACRPSIFRIQMTRSDLQTSIESPVWSAVAKFTDHSYRGLAADGELGQLLLLNIDATTSEQFVSFRDNTGIWRSRGKITFPIRSAYPQVALRNGAGHVMAIGDIREPNQEWQTFKQKVTQRKWDYVFRRLFYVTAPDLSRGGKFRHPIEVESVEATAGHILNLDLHIDATGAVHLLYLKKPHQHVFIRDKYFPGQRITAHLMHVVIREERVVQRETIAETPTDGSGFEPLYARFHIAPEERILVVMAGKLKQPNKPDRIANFLQGIYPATDRHKIKLEHPFQVFFTLPPRGGAPPSNIIDMFGTGNDVPNLRYAAIQL